MNDFLITLATLILGLMFMAWVIIETAELAKGFM